MKMFDKNKDSVLTRSQVRAYDHWAINEINMPGVVLMENAGRSTAELIMEKYPDNSAQILVLCGLGNNGGDGYVIARHLLNSNYNVKTLILGPKSKIKGDAKVNLDSLCFITNDIYEVIPNQAGWLECVENNLRSANVVVDAVFGTGLQGQLRPGYSELFDLINSFRKDIIAVDIPSGLDCDTGEPLGSAVEAKYTVTFVSAKKGYSNPNAVKYTGQIYVAGIGISTRFAPAQLRP